MKMRDFITIVETHLDEFMMPILGHGGGDDLTIDDDRGEGRGKSIRVFDIIWDVEPEEEAELPTEVTIQWDDLENVMYDPDPEDRDDLMARIGAWLTERIHGNLSNFDYEVIY